MSQTSKNSPTRQVESTLVVRIIRAPNTTQLNHFSKSSVELDGAL